MKLQYSVLLFTFKNDPRQKAYSNALRGFLHQLHNTNNQGEISHHIKCQPNLTNALKILCFKIRPITQSQSSPCGPSKNRLNPLDPKNLIVYLTTSNYNSWPEMTLKTKKETLQSVRRPKIHITPNSISTNNLTDVKIVQ